MNPDFERIAAAWRAGEQIYTAQGAPLYAALSRAGAEDPAIMELSADGLDAAKPVHMFIAAHYLLLGGIDHPLGRYFATINPQPEPPEQAWPHFRAFCLEHAAALQELMRDRPVQMTYVERCRPLMPALSHVARLAGEPLHLVELGCSAGVLLTFDKYSYEMREGEIIGPADAAIRLKGTLHDGPPLHIPQIASRTGIDLNIIDPRSAEDRRWMLATCFPELNAEQANLSAAMDIVANTDIRWLEGDALVHVPQVLADTPDPICVYHSACLFYWPDEAKQALEGVLLDASRTRDIHRIGIEPTANFDKWQKGRAAATAGDDEREHARVSGGVTYTLYRGGRAESRDLACNSPDFGTVWWLEGEAQPA